MVRRFFIAMLAVCLSSGALFAQTVVIDPFSVAQTTINNPTFPTTVGPVLQPDGSAAGGFRQVTSNHISGEGAYDLIFDGNTMQSSAGSGVIGSFLLEYGTQAQLNINATGTNAFQFERANLDLSAGFTATITSGAGAVVATYVSGPNEIPGGGLPSSLITVPFAAFTNGGSLDLTDIDAVTFQFTASQGSTQFLLDNIQLVSAVPEPTTIAMLGVSGAAAAASIWYRRRKATRLANAALRR